MSRRYLTGPEVVSALSQGRGVEAMIGPAVVLEQRVIRWLSLRVNSGKVHVELWESCDVGSVDCLDVYEFGTPDGDDEPAILYTFESAEECLGELERHYPGVGARFVNRGVIQSEYADYLRSART
jgi:hypothetical protein